MQHENDALKAIREAHALKAGAIAQEGNLSHGFDLADLMEMDLPEPKFVCKPFIAEGLTIFAGRPKIGKTTLIRQLLLAANNGTEFFGENCEKVQALFLSLEEGKALARNKFKAMADPLLARGIRIDFEWHKGDEGVVRLRQYLTENPSVRLVVIDCLSRFRANANKATPQFQQDYNTITDLQNVCKDFPGLAIIVLHHTTKADFDDPIDCISGTYGLTAACDSYGVLLRKGDQFRLHWGGRLWDSDTCDFELVREGGRWQMLGAWDFDGAGLPASQRAVLEILQKEGTVTCGGIATRLAISPAGASDLLKKLQHAGLVRKDRAGFSAA